MTFSNFFRVIDLDTLLPHTSCRFSVTHKSEGDLKSRSWHWALIKYQHWSVRWVWCVSCLRTQCLIDNVVSNVVMWRHKQKMTITNKPLIISVSSLEPDHDTYDIDNFWSRFHKEPFKCFMITYDFEACAWRIIKGDPFSYLIFEWFHRIFPNTTP